MKTMTQKHIIFLFVLQCVLMLFSCGRHTDSTNDYTEEDTVFEEDFTIYPTFSINDSNACFAIQTSHNNAPVYDTVRIVVHGALKWNEIANKDTAHIVVNGIDTSYVDIWLPIQEDAPDDLWWDWDHSKQDNNKVLLTLMKDIVDYLMKQTYRRKEPDGCYPYYADDTASWMDVKLDAKLAIPRSTPEGRQFWYSVYGPYHEIVTEAKIRQWIKLNKCCQ